MDPCRIRELLIAVRAGKITVEEAFATLKHLSFEDLQFAKVDHHRSLRTGIPEVVFCQGKNAGQIVTILASLVREASRPVLATRVASEMVEVILAAFPEAVFHSKARMLALGSPRPASGGLIGILCAGTSDIPVAEEAAVTAEYMGGVVERAYDVGVAGLHRLLNCRPLLENARVLVVAAGMEGALASVVAGLTGKPIIAVPTSVGYGASFGGLAALLAMMNSCAPGVAVVNIDNGFGAGLMASLIARVPEPHLAEPEDGTGLP